MIMQSIVTHLRARFCVDAYTAVNVAGLAIGFGAALFVALLIREELSYDRFIPDYSRVFRVSTLSQPPGQAISSIARTRPDVAQWLRLDFQAIEAIGRITTSQQSVRRGDVEAMETVYWADPEFLRVMTFPTVAGDVRTALDQPDGVVLTQSLARKYFGRDDPLGQTIEIDRTLTMRVAAVIEDLPRSSHLDITMLASGRAAASPFTQIDSSNGSVKALSVYTYLKLRASASIESLQRALPALIQRRAPPDTRMELAILPVADIHLHASGTGEITPGGSIALLVALASIGVLILLTATINYVNLMTARGAQRALEVGVRKSFGARRRELIVHFMGESIAYVALASMLAVLLVLVSRPWLNALLDVPIPAGFWRDPQLIAAIVPATLGLGALAAIYPALVLSAFRPSVVLKGGPVDSSGSGTVRQVLIAAQLAVLVGLLIGTVCVYQQGRYAANEGLRLNNELVLSVETPVTKPCNAALRDEIRALPGVRAAACSLMAPFANSISDLVRTRNEEDIALHQSPIDFDFFEVYGIKPVAGRLFTRARAAADSAPTDANAPREAPIVLNETAVRRLGFASNEDAIGQTILWRRLRSIRGEFGARLPAEIIGVVADFPMGTIRKQVEPTVYAVDPGLSQYIHVKISGRQDVTRTLSEIDRLWGQLGEARPITRRFADERMQRLYESITRQTRALAAFSTVAIFVACLGMFGLAAFTTERRKKEVGIRKALGARRNDIVLQFLWQFTVPVLWATIVALPVTYIFTRRWLDGFAYRVDVGLQVFIAAALLTWAIACATVLIHVLRAARAHPLEALRYE